MSTNLIAFGVSAALVAGLIITLVLLNFLTGTLEFLFGRPKFTILRSNKGNYGFAFRFRWNGSKEPANIDHVKLRLFNPFGKPSQVELMKKFEDQTQTFEMDLDMGVGFEKVLKATNLENALIQVELSASKDGVVYQYDMKAMKFFNQRKEAKNTLSGEYKSKSETQSAFDKYLTHLPKNMTEDIVPGKGAYLKIATNPIFADAFGSPVPGQAAAAGGGGGATAEAVEDFIIKKVWIAPGCIVCNACEDIYPEVFDVQADTCLIRPDAQNAGSPLLDKGLLIEEAAEACPVEVIKYDKA